MNMSHHVVPCHLLLFGGRFEVDVVDMSLHLGDLFRFDGQTKFLKERRRWFFISDNVENRCAVILVSRSDYDFTMLV